jgi:SAM-dependent methyltransferase
MNSSKKIEIFLDTVIKENLFKAKFFSSKEKLRFNLKTLFKGIDLTGKRVLDIGGGFGLHSFYAGCLGAEEVICLEPEIEGSSALVIEKYKRLQNQLNMNNVMLKTETFQDFNNDGKLFDLILSHYSINHLDESACITLLENEESKNKYKSIAVKLSSMAKQGATIIVCDCSNHNFFAHLGIKNPFAPTISWNLHHAPEIWIKILKGARFTNEKIKWTSFGEFKNIGRLLIGYKYISYFLNSHYCFRMTKE